MFKVLHSICEARLHRNLIVISLQILIIDVKLSWLDQVCWMEGKKFSLGFFPVKVRKIDLETANLDWSHTNCRPGIKRKYGMMNSPFVRIFMHLWRRFDQTAVNEEFYSVTLSQLVAELLKQSTHLGNINFNLQPDGHWSPFPCLSRDCHCSQFSLPILEVPDAGHHDDDDHSLLCHPHCHLSPETRTWSCRAQFYFWKKDQYHHYKRSKKSWQ